MHVSEHLADHHLLDSFDSGQPALDTWLRDDARAADRKRVGFTYVWHAEDNVVLAYFTLCPHVLERRALPGKVGRGAPARIPAILLAQLALDRQLHGQRLGSQLLVDALTRAVSASDEVGGRYVVIDAIDEDAAHFYEHHDFLRCPSVTPARLLRKVADIAKALD